MLKSHFIPTMEKLKKRAGKVVAEEDQLRMEGKMEVDSENGTIRDEFAVLCRDLYALYPLLIRYVDNSRSPEHHATLCLPLRCVLARFLWAFIRLLRAMCFVSPPGLQGEVADLSRPRCRRTVQDGWRSLHFLVQIPRGFSLPCVHLFFLSLF